MRHGLFALAVIVALGLSSCPDPDAKDAGPIDAARVDAAADVATIDMGPEDAVPEDAGPCANDDSYEPNNSSAEAAEVDLPLALDNLLACDEHDWYLVEVPAGNGLEVSVTFSHADSDLDLYIYRSNDLNTPLQNSTSYADVERVVQPLFESNTWVLIDVRNFGNSSGGHTTYRLEAKLWAGGFCQNDSFEPNDSVELATAIEWQANALVLCGDDVDVFAFSVQDPGPGTRVVVARGDFPVEIEVLDASDQAVGTLSHNEERGLSVLSFESQAGVLYHARIRQNSSGTRVQYALRVYGAPPVNDTCAGAIAASLGTTISGNTRNAANDYAFALNWTSCTGYAETGSDVVYQVQIPVAQRLTARLTSDQDMAVYLLDDCASRCCWAGTDLGLGGQDELLVYDNNSGMDQNLYLVVDSFSPASSGAFLLRVGVGTSAEDPGAIDAGQMTSCLADLNADAGSVDASSADAS